MIKHTVYKTTYYRFHSIANDLLHQKHSELFL